jgi:predicted esterase
MQQSIDYILSLVDAEVASGTPEERIVLGGFSQGQLLPKP